MHVIFQDISTSRCGCFQGAFTDRGWLAFVGRSHPHPTNDSGPNRPNATNAARAKKGEVDTNEAPFPAHDSDSGCAGHDQAEADGGQRHQHRCDVEDGGPDQPHRGQHLTAPSALMKPALKSSELRM
jgi:hypothetical protein